MDNIFLKDLNAFIMINFKFDPSTGQNVINLPKKMKKKYNLNDLKFPGNNKLSNYFYYESLSLLLKMQNLSKGKKEDIIGNFLQIVYTFYNQGKETIIPSLDILGYIIPYKDSKKIKNCFCENDDDFISFLIFNLVLLNYKKIHQSFYDSIYFDILEIVLLYDYIFIRGCVKNNIIKYEVTKVIKIILNDYTATSEINSNLKNFFFESGKITKNSFLIPENESEQGINEINILIDNIYKIIQNGLEFRNILIDNLKNINKLKRKRLNMGEENEIIENTSENSEERKEDKNMERLMKDLQETIKNMKKTIDENEKNFNNSLNIQNGIIEEQKIIILENKKKIEDLQNSDIENKKKIEDLQNSMKEQNNTIEAQALNIEALNTIILNKETIIEEKEKSIKDLKQDISIKSKDLSKTKISLNQSKIRIDNQSTLLIKNNQLINKLNGKVHDLERKNKENESKITELNTKDNTLSNKIDLIGCRDFLRRVILDFCYFFNVNHYNDFKDAARLINIEIKNKKNITHFEEFTKKVNLARFIEIIGNILDDSDNLSHLYFKELSIKYRYQDIKSITNVENIKKNINKCKNAVHVFSKINFDSVFSFFINDIDYPNFLINNIPIEEKDWTNAITKNINNK